MIQYKIAYIITIIVIMGSCNPHKNKSVALVKTDSICFKLDSQTKNNLFNYSLYDENGKSYFSFQNRNSNDILFYDINSKKLEFKITPKVEGNNGIGFISGYYIHNMDSIYLTNLDTKEISLINKDCNIINKYAYDYDCDNNELSLFSLSGFNYKPAQEINRTLYLYSGPNRYIDKDPVSIAFNMDTHNINSLNFYYPEYPGSDIKLKKYGLEDTFSRCYDGVNFIYSFYYDENIYVTTPSHKTINKVQIKSKYIDKVQLPNELKASPEDFCLNAWYGNLLYDQYRKVYYRIAYPESDNMDKGVNPIELFDYGRKNFSIIILDKELNIIGETLFPDYTYNSGVLFINKEGLYISSSHSMNPTFNDDILSFHKFELQYHE